MKTELNFMPVLETSYLYWLSQALYVITKLDIPLKLMSRAKTIPELINELKEEYPNSNEANLYRLLRNLSALNLFQEEGNQFSLSKSGKTLLDTKVHRLIINLLGPENWAKITAVGEEGSFEHFQNNFAQTYPFLNPELAELILAYSYSKSLYLFSKFNLAECFSDVSHTLDDLAKKSQIKPAILETICMLLSKKGVLQKTQDKYLLTEAGKLLKQGPKSLHNIPLHENIAKWQAAANLFLAVTEGKQPFKETHKQELFYYLKSLEDPTELHIFNQAMAEITEIENKGIVAGLDFPSGTNTVMDVGGGTGALMNALLLKHRNLSGTVFDLPETIQKIDKSEMICDFVGGSFFERETIPSVDLILLKRALHDWSDKEGQLIVQNCAQKCKSLGVIEWLWVKNPLMASLDFALMSIGGKIRSEQEFQVLLESAGVTFEGVHNLASGVFVVNGSTDKRLEREFRPGADSTLRRNSI
jgi:hypothetical protein